MKFKLSQEKPRVKEAILLELIPAFPPSEIESMTGLKDNNIAYYRRKHKSNSFTIYKRTLQAEAQKNIRDQIEHKQEYALSVVEDILHDNGIPYE